MKEMCYYHGTFGAVASNCYAENYNLQMAATSMVYANLINAYGGPLGVASNYLSTYFPFVSDLPLRKDETVYPAFVRKFSPGKPWKIANTVANGAKISQPWNYGFGTWFSEAASEYSNQSVTIPVSASSNIGTGVMMFPFSLATQTTANFVSARILAHSISLAMIKGLAAVHSIMTTTEGANCVKGCPIMDGSFSDKIGMTQGLKKAATLATRPTNFHTMGDRSAISTLKYLSGFGPMDIYSPAVSSCVLTDTSKCTVLGKFFELGVDQLPTSAKHSIQDTFQVYNPEATIIKPQTGNPMTFDTFTSDCESHGHCSMTFTVIPSKAIEMVPQNWNVATSLIYLENNAKATSFCNQYLPQDAFTGTNVCSWFPNFSPATRGGVAFNSLPGQSLMDYVSYIVTSMSR